MTNTSSKGRAVVFGGSGFLGGHIADRLCEQGYSTVIADLAPSTYLRKDQQFVQCDILDFEKVSKIVEGADFVYNTAAIADIEEAAQKPLPTVRVNILGTTHILEACRLHKVKRFLFASTVYVFSHRGSFYRSSKQACEKIIENYHEQFGLDFTILRYGSLYGPRASETNSLRRYVRQALESGEIRRTGDGEELREYIHVLDAAESSVEAISDEFKNRYLLITGMQPLKVKEVLGMIREIMGQKIRIEYLPALETSHYELTPYSFRPESAHRLVMKKYYDLGQGLFDLLHELQGEMGR
jgi:UDP-glucose 4-epimerase